jgi:hypothetical protein
MTEAEEQKEIVAHFRAKYPRHVKALRVSMLGGHRGRNRKEAAIRTAKAIGQGAVIGESDIVILLPRGRYGALVIEHKSAVDKRGASTDQLDYIAYHNNNGNCACVTAGVKAATTAIDIYMALPIIDKG